MSTSARLAPARPRGCWHRGSEAPHSFALHDMRNPNLSCLRAAGVPAACETHNSRVVSAPWLTGGRLQIWRRGRRLDLRLEARPENVSDVRRALAWTCRLRCWTTQYSWPPSLSPTASATRACGPTSSFTSGRTGPAGRCGSRCGIGRKARNPPLSRDRFAPPGRRVRIGSLLRGSDRQSVGDQFRWRAPGYWFELEPPPYSETV
jgi:hypothetical protein